MSYRFNHRHLLGIADLSAEDIYCIVSQTEEFLKILSRPIPKVPTLRDKTIVNLFFENSTRTRLSFELAQKRMGADVINFSPSTASVKKGESLLDTVLNVEAMRVDIAVIRHNSPGVPYYIARSSSVQVINAGDGAHEHPTQALLDVFTLMKHLGDLKGKKIAIVGDIRFSRVVRSNILALKKLGAEIMLCGPKTLMPIDVNSWDVNITYHLDEALAWCDAVITLRLQFERQAYYTSFISTIREYYNEYAIKAHHLDKYPNFIILHPGPINRGVEIDNVVADSGRSCILEQVTNGVALRMGILYLLVQSSK